MFNKIGVLLGYLALDDLTRKFLQVLAKSIRASAWNDFSYHKLLAFIVLLGCCNFWSSNLFFPSSLIELLLVTALAVLTSRLCYFRLQCQSWRLVLRCQSCLVWHLHLRSQLLVHLRFVSFVCRTNALDTELQICFVALFLSIFVICS